jgi:hypothetical protein
LSLPYEFFYTILELGQRGRLAEGQQEVTDSGGNIQPAER